MIAVEHAWAAVMKSEVPVVKVGVIMDDDTRWTVTVERLGT